MYGNPWDSPTYPVLGGCMYNPENSVQSHGTYRTYRIVGIIDGKPGRVCACGDTKRSLRMRRAV